jgi:hypothetical protein
LQSSAVPPDAVAVAEAHDPGGRVAAEEVLGVVARDQALDARADRRLRRPVAAVVLVELGEQPGDDLDVAGAGEPDVT